MITLASIIGLAMSNLVTGLVFKRYPRGGGELLVALALADECNDEGGNIRPGVPALAAKVRMSDKQVRRILRVMVDDGWLLVVSAQHGKGEVAFAEYRINPQWLIARGVRPETEDLSVAQMTGQNDRTKCPVIPHMTGHYDQSSVDSGAVDKSAAVLTNLPPLISPPSIEKDFDFVGSERDEVRRFCEWMLAELRKLNPQHAVPRNWDRWERDVRKLGKTHSLKEIGEMLRFAMRDDFWAAVVRSPGGLVKHWDKLTAKRAITERKSLVSTQVVVTTRVCACGCGKIGVRSFKTDGSEWWAAACYESEALRREVAA